MPMINGNDEFDSLHVNNKDILHVERTDINRSLSSLTTINDPSFESTLRKCGDFGRFQWMHFFFINLLTMSGGLVSFYYVFAAAEPEHRCRLPSNVWPNDTSYYAMNLTHEYYLNQSISQMINTNRWERCVQIVNRTVIECTHGWVYDRSIFGYTFTEEANMVCQQKSKKSWLATSMQCGGFSLLIIGSLADRYGRKNITCIITLLLFSICLLSQILMQFFPFTVQTKFFLLLINQFASGLVMSTFSLVFILMLELTSNTHTKFAANLAFLSYTFGEILVAFFAYLAYDWQVLKWANTAFIGLGIPYLYFMPESPLYFYSKRQYGKLERLLRRIALTNGRKESDWYSSYEELIRCPLKKEEKFSSRFTRTLLIQLFIVTLLGFTSLMLYYKISYGLAVMNISPYLAILIGAILEGTAYLTTSILLSSKLGRKGSLIIMMSLTIFSLLCLPNLMKYSLIGTILVAQFGKYSISGTILITWIFVPELFPTSIRSTANGFFIASSRIGAIMASVIDSLVTEEYLVYTNYFSSILGVIVLLLCLILPETKDKRLSS